MAEEERAFEPRTGICALSRAIQGTEAEIAAPGLGGISMLESASHELDAVVQAAESATNDIPAAAEKIDDIARKMPLNAGRDAERQMAEEIMACAITYFEARNIQDITGQHT